MHQSPKENGCVSQWKMSQFEIGLHGRLDRLTKELPQRGNPPESIFPRSKNAPQIACFSLFLRPWKKDKTANSNFSFCFVVMKQDPRPGRWVFCFLPCQREKKVHQPKPDHSPVHKEGSIDSSQSPGVFHMNALGIHRRILEPVQTGRLYTHLLWELLNQRKNQSCKKFRFPSYLHVHTMLANCR